MSPHNYSVPDPHQKARSKNLINSNELDEHTIDFEADWDSFPCDWTTIETSVDSTADCAAQSSDFLSTIFLDEYSPLTQTLSTPSSLDLCDSVDECYPFNDLNQPLPGILPELLWSLPLPWIDLSSLPSSPPNMSTQPSSFAPSATVTQSALSDTSLDSTTSNPNYVCAICDERFDKQYILNKHTKVHTKPVVCSHILCNHRTATNRDMLRHFQSRHPGNITALAAKLTHSGPASGLLISSSKPVCPIAECKYAKTGFSRPDHLTRHLKKQHSKGIS